MTVENAKALFRTNILGNLATVNEDGSPRSTPLHLVADEEAVYWFSSENTVHSRNIARDERVSVTLFSPDESQGPTGVYLHGPAEKVTGEARKQIVQLFTDRTGMFPPSFDGAAAYRVAFGYPNEEQSTRRCWYFYN